MAATACRECRIRKVKCRTSVDSQRGSCVQCLKKKTLCSNNRTSSQYLQRLPILPKINDRRDQRLALPEIKTLLKIVDSYFIYMHDQPHSLFHPESLIKSITSGSTSDILLHAITGVAGRFVNGFPHKVCSDHYKEAKRLLLADIENVCLENVQACILVVCTSLSGPDFNSEAIFYSLAVRLAQILKLDCEHIEDDFITRETKRRIWWSLYMMDSWSSGGLDLPRLIVAAPSDFSIRLPMLEHLFKTGAPIELELNNKHGLWDEMVKLAYIYRQIQDFNKRLVAKTVADVELESTLTSLCEKLNNWLNDLPSGMKFNEENFASYQSIGLVRPFVALHLGYHHYSTLLYFQFLDEEARPALLREPFSARCIYHAESFSSLICRCFDNNIYLLYSAIGQMTIVSSSVMLHRLLFEESNTASIRKKLEANYSVLITLRKYWEGIDITISRLQVFQNACKLLMDGAYKMDKWMLKFLLQYSTRMGEKTDIENFFSQTMQFEKSGESLSSFLTTYKDG